MHEVERMVFTGKRPWWYGNDAQRGAVGVDLGANAITSEQAMKAAGLDWLVQKRQGGFIDTTCTDVSGAPVWREVKHDYKLVRDSDNSVLGSCGKDYEIFQNHEAFSFLDQLVSDGSMVYHTAGSLEMGKRVWILAQTPNTWVVKRRSGKENRHHAFLMAMLGHSGTTGISLMPTDVRVECANTAGWADEQAESKNVVFRIKHTGDVEAKMDLAAQALEVMENSTDERAEALQAMCQHAMNTDEFIDFAMSVCLGLSGSDEQIEEGVKKFYEGAHVSAKTKMENKVADLAKLFESGQGNEGDSLYDALNAFTEAADHAEIGKVRNQIEANLKASRHVRSAWLGAGGERKALVYKRLRAKILA